MGFYSMVFSVPQNTAEETPVTTSLPVGSGVIHTISVFIPSGHAGLTGCAIDVGLHQVAPTNQNEWFKGDDVHYIYPEHIPLPDGTRHIVLRGYNESDHEDHTFIVAVGVLPEDVITQAEALRDVFAPLMQSFQQLLSFFAPPEAR